MTNKTPAPPPRAQWFLLRGLARESGHWAGFVEKLREAFPEHAIHTLDLPGTGEFQNQLAPLSIEETARFVRETYQARRIPGVPAYVLAISLGGMVAIEWLHQDPSGVEGLVLINTSFRGCSPFYKRLWFDAYPFLARAIGETDTERREHHVVSLVSNRPELYAAIAREWAHVHERRPISRRTFARQLLAAARYQPPLAPPQARTLLLNSLSDRMVHPSCSEAIAERWHCELRRHPTAGHDLVLDAGPWVIAELQTWLAKQKNPA
ncbi:MAG: alpha/beta hydrolase [Bdellovibrionaceae bacterium]|nr:alpha/beta hydrolase [Pseudobdellovibrionaceae bacterium]